VRRRPARFIEKGNRHDRPRPPAGARRKLAEERPFSADKVAATSGSPLHVDANDSDEYSKVFNWGGGAGNKLLKSIELRVPGPKATAKDGLLILDVAKHVTVTAKEVMREIRRQAGSGPPSPRQPAGCRSTIAIRKPGARSASASIRRPIISSTWCSTRRENDRRRTARFGRLNSLNFNNGNSCFGVLSRRAG